MTLRKTWSLVVAAPLLWACGNQVDVGLNARVGAARTPASGPGRLEQSLTLDNGIVIDRVRIVVRDLELEREGDDSDDGVSSSSGEGDDTPETEASGEFETGPFVLDLSGAALEGQLVALPGVAAAAGVYDEIELKVGKPSDSDVAGNAALKEMQEKNASVIVDGTLDGQAFSFVSDQGAEQERAVHFELGGAESPNVTLNIDVRTWFIKSDGTRLDPRNGENKSVIESNIKSSIDAFDDDDKDGAEDHDEDESGDD